MEFSLRSKLPFKNLNIMINLILFTAEVKYLLLLWYHSYKMLGSALAAFHNSMQHLTTQYLSRTASNFSPDDSDIIQNT